MSSLRNLSKVTQSPTVPRVRGGDPSGVAPGKVEDDISGQRKRRRIYLSYFLDPKLI
jgi:hypothetical protein